MAEALRGLEKRFGLGRWRRVLQIHRNRRAGVTAKYPLSPPHPPPRSQQSDEAKSDEAKSDEERRRATKSNEERRVMKNEE
ncbi:hypothetical protein BDZ91DRAFT_800696 [Kalaharituber pfeilii]|nr:hypothetical protein BDZ91DRAFT_800696 [Kalaharituber pfeilii]